MSSTTIYTLGYSKVKIEELEAIVERDSLVIIDTRFNPYSPNPVWQKAALSKRFGAQYAHIGALGNKLYKEGGIEIADLAIGVEQVRRYLADGISVVLMCACADLRSCHRRVVCEAVAEASLCPVVHWTPDDLRPVKQERLF